MKKAKKLPILCWIVYGFSLISAGLYLAFRLSPSFADTFNQSVSQFARHVLAKCTYWIPFSLAEWLVLCVPVLFAFLVWIAIRATKDSSQTLLSFLGKLLVLPCAIFCLFVWTFAPGYAATGIDQKLGLERKEVSETDLLRATLSLSQELDEQSGSLHSSESGFTRMPYSIAELNQKLLTAYEDFTSDVDWMSTYYSKVKPVLTSKLLSYSHITGIYSFPTGEANINTDFPDYTLPFTMAHELAHQRGIAREDEANFVAYLVCIKSEDPYIRYSATLSLWEYMMNAMYVTNPEYYKLLLDMLAPPVKAEEEAYAVFYQQYAENALADVNDFVNDTYLKSQGEKEGNRSYDLVVDLAVAFFKSEGKIP